MSYLAYLYNTSSKGPGAAKFQGPPKFQRELAIVYLDHRVVGVAMMTFNYTPDEYGSPIAATRASEGLHFSANIVVNRELTGSPAPRVF